MGAITLTQQFDTLSSFHRQARLTEAETDQEKRALTGGGV